MIAVADTGPLLYLALTDRISLLPQLFEKILIPQQVAIELSQSSTPKRASALLFHPPSWLEICSAASLDSRLGELERGEQEAIQLAMLTGADVLLTDDAAAKTIARQTMGLTAYGTIGVLYEAALNERIEFTAATFDQAIEQLLTTNFYASPTLRESINRLSHKLHGIEGSTGPDL